MSVITQEQVFLFVNFCGSLQHLQTIGRSELLSSEGVTCVTQHWVFLFV